MFSQVQRRLQLLPWLALLLLSSTTSAGLIEDLYPVPANSNQPGDGGSDTYSPLNFRSVASLDMDMRSINGFLASDTPSGLESAKNIFSKGAFSDAFANLQIVDQDEYSTFSITPGATVVGKTASGNLITGIAKYGKSETPFGSTNVLRVHYPDYPPEQTKDGCFVGGNLVPLKNGCFAPSGRITITQGNGLSLDFDYKYDPDVDNVNGLSLASLDRLRASLQNTPTFNKFMQYYGTDAMYYDQEWITAAFEGRKTRGWGLTDTNGAMDFSVLGMEGRGAAIRWGIVTLQTYLFIINSIEDAVANCGTEDPDDQKYIMNRWDMAVAAYSGSEPIYSSTNIEDGGYFLYTLAQIDCKNFGTCNPGTGVAKVNQYAFESFRNGRGWLETGDCQSAQGAAENLRELLVVPLVQGVLRTSHALDKHDNTQETIQGQAAAYAASILPLLNACSAGNAFMIYDDLTPGRATASSFEVIKDALERAYECLGITCQDVGGLRTPQNDGYFQGAEPCGNAFLGDSTVSSGTSPTESNYPPTFAPISNNGGSPTFVPLSGQGAAQANANKIKSNNSMNRQEALTIGISVGLGVLAALIALCVYCCDAGKSKEFDSAAPITKSAVEASQSGVAEVPAEGVNEGSEEIAAQTDAQVV